MGKRRIAWLVLSLVIFTTFYFNIIPVAIYNKNPFLFSVIGALLLFCALVQSVFDYTELKSVLNLFRKNLKWNKSDGLILLFGVACFFLLFVFHVQFYKRKSVLLKNEGRMTYATILDKYNVGTRHGFLNFVKLQFKIDNNELIECIESINEEEYGRINPKKPFLIIYYPEYPKVVDLIIQDKSIKEYLKIPQRPLSIEDIFKFVDECNSMNELYKRLGEISYKWEQSKKSKSVFWINENFVQAVKIENGKLTFRFTDSKLIKKIKRTLEENRYNSVEINKNNVMKRYYNGNYEVEILSNEFQMNLFENTFFLGGCLYGISIKK